MVNNNQNPQDDVIDIGLILLKLCNFKTIRNIILAAVLCAVCAYGYSSFLIDDMFTSDVNLYVNNNSVSTGTGKIESNDITASQKIVESCIVILGDDIVMDEIGQRLISDFSAEEISRAFNIGESIDGNISISNSQIKSTISLSGINETEVLNVSVTTKSPQISLAICNYMVDIAPKMVNRVIDGGRIEAVGEPRLPLAKSYPDNRKNALMGGFLGGAVVLGIYVILILIDNKITNTEEFNNRSDYPVLAEIPLYESNEKNINSRRKKKEKEGTLPTQESFNVVEAYNSLCSNIIFSCRANDSNVIILSSSEAGAGKSTISSRVAESLNNTVGNVLLMDCDMRRPTVHKKFGLDNKKGLSTILNGMNSLEEVIHVDDNGFSILTSGPTPPNVAEILASKYMDEIMEKCMGKYNYIIMDTPPINIVNDASIISKYSGGLTFVARSGSTRYNDLKKAETILDIADTKITGVIINAVSAENAYYGKYSKYGKYGKYSKYRYYNSYGGYDTATTETKLKK